MDRPLPRPASHEQPALGGPAALERTATIPRATYRVQLHRDFRFEAARALVPYLARLGISHLYCSPFLRARAGSRHGYDVVDHNQFNPEIGSRDDFDALAATLKAHGMGLLIDIVPNHMGVLGGDNAWWMDVLENGQASSFAAFFDIDWNVADPALAQRVLLPILGDQYGVVLERGELKLAFDPAAGRFTLHYFDHRLPIDPATYPVVLDRALKILAPGALDAAATDALARLLASFRRLPPRDSVDPSQRAERQRDKDAYQRSLATLVQQQPALAAAIGWAVTDLNGDPQQRSSFDALDTLIETQAYRLAFWRVAGDEINYRRFFDINDLAALRMEEPQVFDATHRLVLDLATSGRVEGLRIDHPDGLFDPAAYFKRLQERYANGRPGAAPASVRGKPARPLYVVAEKIIAPHERLPTEWPVFGTTGYRFANVVTGLFVDTGAKARLDRTWRAFVGAEAADFDDLASECRALVMRTSLAGELGVLANELLRLARADRRTRDFTLSTLRRALADVVAHFPVYRTYIAERASALDRKVIDWTVGRAKAHSRVDDASVFDFLHEAMLARAPTDASKEVATRYRRFARRLQQYTAPVTAKGIEDTALYRHHRLVALNEVGGDPDVFGITVRGFHGATRDRARHWPHTMLATSSHDTKRSEDVRARLAVISEMPAAWRLAVRRWSRLNRSHRREVDGRPAPTPNDQYLLYQTLVGTLPAELDDPARLDAYRERIDAYMRKALREARLRTSWIAPNVPYEEAVSAFVGALLGRLEGNLFLQDVREAARTFAWFGALNGIAMAAIKCTSPGVPDIYQGEEMIELALVDPDNRRAVDYEARRHALDALQGMPDQPDLPSHVQALLESAPDGRAKLWTVWRALQLRRDKPRLFELGGYEPVDVSGTRSRHAVAYLRRHESDMVIVVAGRLFASLSLAVGELPTQAVWRDTAAELRGIGARSRLTDVLTGTQHDIDPARRLSLDRVLAHFPVAILHGALAA